MFDICLVISFKRSHPPPLSTKIFWHIFQTFPLAIWWGRHLARRWDARQRIGCKEENFELNARMIFITLCVSFWYCDIMNSMQCADNIYHLVCEFVILWYCDIMNSMQCADNIYHLVCEFVILMASSSPGEGGAGEEPLSHDFVLVTWGGKTRC